MEKIQPTYKVYRCLALARPIISTRWLTELCASSDTNFNYPPFDIDYLPPIDDLCIDEESTPNFTPNPSRSRLFRQKIFLFFDEQQVKL